MQSFVRSRLGSTLQRINIVVESIDVRYRSEKAKCISSTIPKKPPRPLNAKDRYAKDIEPQLRAEYPSCSSHELKIISREMWKELSGEVKRSYQVAAKEDAEKYDEDMQLYICSLTDEQSAALVLRRENVSQKAKLRELRSKLSETGLPRKPGTTVTILLSDLHKAKKTACTEVAPLEIKSYNGIRERWKQLSEEKKEEYKAKYVENKKLHDEEVSRWVKKIEATFGRWAEIDAVVQKGKTVEDFDRPVKPPSAFVLYHDQMKSESRNGEEPTMQICLAKWEAMQPSEKDEYFAEAQYLHDMYVKELDEWNAKMEKILGRWVDKMHSNRKL